MGNVAHRVLTMRRQRKVAEILNGGMTGMMAALAAADDWRCRAARARERPHLIFEEFFDVDPAF
jgi:hypothetical protein